MTAKEFVLSYYPDAKAKYAPLPVDEYQIWATVHGPKSARKRIIGRSKLRYGAAWNNADSNIKKANR